MLKNLKVILFFSLTILIELDAAAEWLLFSGEIHPPSSLVTSDDKKLEDILGWDLPGESYEAADGWFALVCDQANVSCQLHSTNLTITKASHSVYDSDPVPGQFLQWAPLPFNLGKPLGESEQRPQLIALLKPDNQSTIKLKSGSIKTFIHKAADIYPKTDRLGTLEVRITYQKNQFMDLIPRMQMPSKNDEFPKINTIEIRSGLLRQQLEGFQISPVVGTGFTSPKDYLIWAGDLDGDERPDLILRHADSENHISLYLSTLAQKGEIVGLAGSFVFSDPSSPGC